MNKKQAVAYAQIALNFMLGPKYNGELDAESFGLEMRQCFKLYPRDIVLSIADAQIKAKKKLEAIKNGSDENG